MERQTLTAPARVAFSGAFIAGDARASAFLPADYRNPAARVERTRAASQRGTSPALVTALRAQDGGWPPSASRARNLDALAAPGTAVVVTGQQVGLFLGPLYTFYKAASAVAVARALERESGVRCVPLFWLQTEDHDFAEVNHCHVPAPGDGCRRIALLEDPPEDPRARASLAHRALGEEVSAGLAALSDALQGLPEVDAVMGLLGTHYRPGASMAAAFGSVIAALFADEGLLVLNPRDPQVARLAAAVHRTAWTQSDALFAALLARCGRLEAEGFEVQIPVRNASLSFFHPHSVAGPRYRLERQDGGWRATGMDGPLSTEAILKLLDEEPLRFSTSALLRPILQDALLPTAAYVAGPGELNYFAQMEPLYRAYELSPPLVVPRARFRLIDPRARGLLDALGLQPADAELPREEIARRVSDPKAQPSSAPASGIRVGPPEVQTRRAEGSEELRGRLLQGLSRELDALDATADEGLRKAIRRTRESVAHNVDRLVRRYDRLHRQRDQITHQRVERLRTALCPEGVPQERYYCFAPFAARHGIAQLKTRVFDALDPFSGAVKDIAL
jgi:bacillithiol biosynthesis cysteine-adding enzyme BshC